MLSKNIITFLPYLLYESRRKRLGKQSFEPASFNKSDYYPHRQYAIEWWYFSGVFRTQCNNRLLGCCATLFRIEAPFEGRILHISVTEPENHNFQYRNIAIPLYPKWMDPKKSGCIISIFGNSLWYDAANNRLNLNAGVAGLNIKLSMKLCEVAGHGRNGIIQLESGKCGESFYYSLPNLACTGEIKTSGNIFKVDGEVWHDRQWGNFNLKNIRWDWFSIRFCQDKLYIMIYNCRNDEKEWFVCTLMNDGGQLRTESAAIKASDFFIARGGIKYPLDFEIIIQSENRVLMQFNIKPLIKNQSITSFITPSYWEGLCRAEGYVTEGFALGGQRYEKGLSINGDAYAELVGYE